jgi:hypothetical protein
LYTKTWHDNALKTAWLYSRYHELLHGQKFWDEDIGTKKKKKTKEMTSEGCQ